MSFVYLALLFCSEPENILIFSVKSTLVLLPCLQISLPFTGHERAPIICLLMTRWKLLSESNNKFSISSFIFMGASCLTSLRSAQRRQCRGGCGGKMSSRSQVIHIEVQTHVIEQLCSFSSGQHDTRMAKRILVFILELIHSHQSCWARCITFPGSLKLLPLPSFFFKLDMLCWKKCLSSDEGCSSFL